MKQSTTIANLAKALVSAQKSIEAGVVKNAVNVVYNTTYADLGTVIRAVKDSLGDVGVAVIQSPTLTDAQGYVCLTTRLLHESGEWLEDTCSSPLQFTDPQAFGSAVSYLRRYALTAMLGLYQRDDDASAATGLDRQSATAPAAPAVVPSAVRGGSTKTAQAAPVEAGNVDPAAAVSCDVGNSTTTPRIASTEIEELSPEARKRVDSWLNTIKNASLERLETSRSSASTTFKGAAFAIVDEAFEVRIATLRAGISQPA